MPDRRELVGAWLVAAVVLGLLLALARAQEGPLDDPDPARQRPGFLDLGRLPEPAPPVAPGLPARDHPSVVFFLRPAQFEGLCSELPSSGLADRAALAVVVAGSATSCPAVEAVVEDADGALADRHGMRRPRDGGPPVGYAVVDGKGRIRYRTLDPEVAGELREVGTIVEAVQ